MEENVTLEHEGETYTASYIEIGDELRARAHTVRRVLQVFRSTSLHALEIAVDSVRRDVKCHGRPLDPCGADGPGGGSLMEPAARLCHTPRLA